MAESELRLRLFGEPALEGSGGPIVLRTLRQLGILLFGMIEGPRVRREQLIPLFWPGAPERRGRHSLAQALSELRTALPNVLRSEHAYLVVGGLTSDLDLLRRHPDLVARGGILEGIDRLGGIELSQWLDAARERIRRDGTRSLEQSLRSALDATDRSAFAEAILTLDPANEHAVITLAEQDLDQGRVTEAVRRLRRYQEHITAELGYDPQPRVATLLRRLERGDAVRAREAILGDPVRLDTSPGPVVGRDAEAAVLAQAWEDVCGGRRRSVRLSGAAGMGKSILIRNFMASLASRGHLAFVITCHQATRAVPFAMLADLIDALATDPGFIASDPTWLAEASRIHPALRGRFPGIPEPGEAPPESVRERLVEATTEILATIADGTPVAVAFDDADQGDEASLSVIGLMRRRVRRHSLLVLAATSEPDDPVDDAPLECDRHLYLGKVASKEIVALLKLQANTDPEGRMPEGILERVATLADGNPQFALTLLADHECHQLDRSASHQPTEWTPPRDLMAAIAGAAMRHSTLARRVLAVLATAGRAATIKSVAEVAGLSDTDVRAAAVELLAHDRVRIANDEIHLTSPLWQAAIYHLEPAGVRRYLHERWARVIAKSDERPDYERLPETARHEVLAGNLDDAAHHFREGARAALATGAPGEARRALEHAFALPVTHNADAWALFAEALAAQGRYNDALDALATVDRLVGPVTTRDRSGSTILRLEAMHRLGVCSPDEIRDELCNLAGTRGASLPRTQELRTLQLRAELARQTADRDELGRIWQALDVAPGKSSVEVARAKLTQGFIRWQQGLFRNAFSMLETAYEMLSDLHLPHEAARAANGAGIAAYATGRFDLALGFFELGLGAAELCEDREIAAGIIGNAALAVEDAGFLDQALQLNQHSIDLAISIRSARRAIHASLNYADVLLLLGRIDEAVDIHGEACRKADETNDEAQAIQALVKLPDLAMARGNWDQGVDHVRQIISIVSKRPIDRFLRSRIVRQTCVASFITGGMITPIDPLAGQGTWTSFGRIEAGLCRAWLRAANGGQAMALGSRLEGPPYMGPMNWLAATGVVLEKPWLVKDPAPRIQRVRADERDERHAIPKRITSLLVKCQRWKD